ncbi:hypothetical protein [Sphingobium yanoikuyae]|uniref:hypothetical protein n=1 Tax=Sphingobium yanoikuyae TaxID=13690 RepID=UPI000262C04C|nr:hypothetical protein [Sphingobium yanoikuyae]
MSMHIAGNYTILRGITRAPIPLFMSDPASIDLDKLKADMAEAVAKTSARKFSLKVTGGRNADFYRNFIGGQDKRMSAEIFIGIAAALEKNPAEYAIGLPFEATLPNATLLTSAFAMLLDTVGIDPFEDGRAQKLARQFPNALQRVSDLRAGLGSDVDSTPVEALPDPAEDRPAA